MLFNIGEFNVVCSVEPYRLAKEFMKYDQQDKIKFFNILAGLIEPREHEKYISEMIATSKDLTYAAKHLLKEWGVAAEDSLNNQEDK